MPGLDVSIVTVNWNTRDLLARAIASVAQHAGGLQVETIVVDNGSVDGSAEMVRQSFPAVRLIANSDNRGYTAACNQGLAASSGRYILFLNSDAELTPGCLETLVRVMDAHPDVGAASPRLSEDPRGVPAGIFPRLWLRLLPTKLNWKLENRMIAGFYREGEVIDVDWLVGACLMVRRGMVEQVGGMEERLFMWYDDAEWCMRMKKRGWRRVVIPGAFCRHEHGASAKKVPSLLADFRMTMAEYTYWRLHRGRLLTAVLYGMRLLRLSLSWARLALLNRLRPHRGPEAAETLQLARARVRWHLKHAGDILLREPRPYLGE